MKELPTNGLTPVNPTDSNKIAGDVVNKATAELGDRERSAIRRFHAYYSEHGLGIEECAKLIRMSGSTLSSSSGGMICRR